MGESVLTRKELERLMPYSFRKKGDKLPTIRRRGPRLSEAVIEQGIVAQDGEIFRLVFESVRSEWEQSVTLVTDKAVIVDNTQYKKGLIVHYSLSHPSLSLIARTREGMLWVWNSWQYRDKQQILRTESHLNYAGMIVEDISNGFRYRCNEGRDDDDYDDLVFRIERTGAIGPTGNPRRDSSIFPKSKVST